MTETGFCSECVADSTEQTPGNISTVNGVGRMFYGGAEPCAKCGSVVRTLWWTFASLPLIPRGSYRYKTVSDDKFRKKTFLARRSSMRWGQVFKTWVLGLAIGVAVFAAFSLWESWKNR